MNALNTSAWIKLDLTHNVLNNRCQEIKFDMHSTIENIKMVCYMKFGTPVEQMQLILQDAKGNNIQTMSEDERPLGFYSPQEGYIIHVIDLNPSDLTKGLEDLSQVEKYMMSEENYDKLPVNFRKWLKNLKQNPMFFEEQEAKVKKIVITDEYMEEQAKHIALGMRCKSIEYGHRGEVKYVGKIPELGLGWYVGIRLDEPFGKSDGTQYGFKYFDCPKGFGLFLRPNKIECGDFPELDIDDEI